MQTLALAAVLSCHPCLFLNGLSKRTPPDPPAPAKEQTEPEAVEPPAGDSAALNICNIGRLARGLIPYRLDAELQKCAEKRLADNVARGRWGHNRKKGRFLGPVPDGVDWKEGVGYTTDIDEWSTCVQFDRGATTAGAAMHRVGSQIWQLLLVR